MKNDKVDAEMLAQLLRADLLPKAWTLATPISRLERQIRTLAKPDPRVEALMALAGVGRLTAMTLLAEIGDIGRFPSARKLCGWAGLTPAVRKLRPKVRHGHITKQGSPWARWVLQEAAQRARTSPPFVAVYAQTAHRGGKQIATVAVARRLLARSFHLLKQLEAAPESDTVKTGRARVIGALVQRSPQRCHPRRRDSV